MTDRELSRLLGAEEGPAPDAASAHRERLEGELLAVFDRTVGASARPPSRGWMRYATAAACLLCLVTATQVPAGYKVEVGKRVSLSLPAGAFAPDELMADVTRAMRTPQTKVVDVRVQRRFEKEHLGPQVLQVDGWGDGLAPDAEALARLRALPALQGAGVQLAPLEGRVPATLLGAVSRRLFHSATTPEAREAARQRLIEELRRVEGPGADVEVDVEEGGGKHRIRVKVKKAPAE